MQNIKINDSEIVVIASGAFVKNDGYIHRTTMLEHTLWLLRDQLKTKTLRVVIPDGEPVVYTALETVISRIQKNYNLPSQRLILQMVDCSPPYENERITVVQVPSFAFKYVEPLQSPNWTMDSDPVLFGGIYGRFNFYRFLMSYFLETQFPDQSFVIFQPSFDHLLFEIDPVKDYYLDQIAWAEQREETNRTYGAYDNGSPTEDYDQATRNYEQVWKKYKLEIICEANLVDHGWFTEKTARCLRTKKPFLLLGAPGQLKKLQDMGFKTFADCINEDYDQIENLDDRFDAITKEITRIGTMSQTEQDQFFDHAKSIAQYNADNYSQIIQKYYQSFNV